MRQAPRVIQRQASRLTELRAMVQASIKDPRASPTDEEVGERLQRRVAELRGARGENA